MEALRRYLSDNNITQVEFAETLGVKQPTVHGWLTDSPPSTRNLKRIAEVTGIPIADLMAGIADKEQVA